MWEDSRYKKIDRIIAILTQLQSKRIVKAQDLASRFDVSIRTIYRDIEILETAGVPIIGEAGTGYTIMEGYRLPPIIFSKEEAMSFVAAEKLLQQYLNDAVYKHFSAALYKVKAVLNWSDKDWIARLDNQISVIKANVNDNLPIPTAMEQLLQAIADNQKVSITYKKPTDVESHSRVVDPIGVYLEFGNWYLIAYCELRADYRQFRLDRMVAVQKIPKTIGKFHGDIASFIQKIQARRSAKGAESVCIKIPAIWEPYTVDNRSYYGFERMEIQGDDALLYFKTNVEDLKYLARWYMMYADKASIHASTLFKEVVHDLYTDIGKAQGFN